MTQLATVQYEDSAPQVPSAGDQSALVGALDQAVQQIEGAFLSAGEVLIGAVDGISALIGQLDRLSQALGQGMIVQTTQDLTQSAENLKSLPLRLAGREAALRQLSDQSIMVRASIEDMSKSLAYLRAFAIYVKIAAAGIGENDKGFTTFAQEISSCIAEGRSQLDSFIVDLDALHAGLQTAIALETDAAQQCQQIVAVAPDAIVSNAQALFKHQAQVASSAQAGSELARSVRKRVGEVVGALQIGDTTRQRIEHVRDGVIALDRLADQAAGDEADGLRRAGSILLAGLLRSARDDFYTEVDRIGANMDGLAKEAAEVMALLGVAHGQGGAQQAGLLTRVETHVADALGMVGVVEGAETSAADVALSATAAAGRLTDRISEIQTLQNDVQLMAFNTRVKCSHIGDEAGPLAVIALELRAQAAALESSADQTLSAVADVSQAAAAVAQALDDARETGAASVARALNDALGRIREAGDRAEGDLRDAESLGASGLQHLNQAAKGLDFRVIIGARMDESLAALASDQAQLDPDSVLTPDWLRFTTDLYASYTMAQEREVHVAVAGCAPQVEGEPAVVEVAAAETEFELF